MVVVYAVEVGDVQGDPRVLRERLEPLTEEFRVHFADLGLRELHLPDEERPPGNVDGDAVMASSMGKCTSA